MKADRAKRNDHDQLGPANVSPSNKPSKKRKRVEDEEPSRPQKKVKREELSDTRSTSTQTPAVKKSESKPEKIIGSMIGRKRKFKKARRGGG